MGWEAKTGLEELSRLMVAADLKQVAAGGDNHILKMPCAIPVMFASSINCGRWPNLVPFIMAAVPRPSLYRGIYNVYPVT